MKKSIILLIFILSLIILSCGKKRTIHITATNGATGERYAGLQYFVVSSTTTGGGEKYKTEKSGFLNENGEATEVVREKQFRTYAVRVVEPENCCYNKEITMYFGGANDKNGQFDFVFAECAYLKLNINNVNCQGVSDYFKLYHYGSDVGFSNFSQGNPIREGGGCYSYSGSDFSNIPMGGRYNKWEVTRNGITDIIYDTLYLSPGEYRTYDINY